LDEMFNKNRNALWRSYFYLVREFAWLPIP